MLGAALLIPSGAAFHVAATGMDRTTAARHFVVSTIMLDYRLKVTGALIRARRRAQRG